MSTATIRIGNVMPNQIGEGRFARSNSRAIAPKQSTGKVFTTRHSHEEWMQRIEDTWRGQLETLQQCMCELLVKNQRLRIAPRAVDEPKRGYRDASNF